MVSGSGRRVLITFMGVFNINIRRGGESREYTFEGGGLNKVMVGFEGGLCCVIMAAWLL